MYYYVYDEFVQDQKYERELANIETRLTDLGISGKIARLALFRDPEEMIRDEVRKGVKTVIAVGNDVTLRKVIDAVSSLGATLGIIPIGKERNSIARILGVPAGVAACDTISARIVEEIDAGKINGAQFLHQVELQAPAGVQIQCGDDFKLFIPRLSEIYLRNLASAAGEFQASHPADGKLELIIRSPQKGWFGQKNWKTSFLPVKNLQLTCEKEMVGMVDNQPIGSDVFTVYIHEKQIRLITGKERNFSTE